MKHGKDEIMRALYDGKDGGVDKMLAENAAWLAKYALIVTLWCLFVIGLIYFTK